MATPTTTTCTATLRSGDGCQRAAVPGLDTCASHRPAALERLAQHAARGGKAAGELRRAAAAARARVASAAAAVAQLEPAATHLIQGGPVLAEVRGLASLARDLVATDAPRAAARASALVQVARLLLDLRAEHEREAELDELREQVASVMEQRRHARRPVDGLALHTGTNGTNKSESNPTEVSP